MSSSDRMHDDDLVDDLAVAEPTVELHESPEDETSCGTGIPWMARFCTAPWFLFFLCSYVLVQTMVVTGLFASSISSLEKRYDMSNTTIGLMAGVYDAVIVCTVAVVSYYGGKNSKPRFLAVGLLTLSIGAFVFALPQFVTDKYEAPAKEDTEICRLGAMFHPSCGGSTQNIVFLFFIAQIIIALGASPLYTLGPPYLDEVVEPLKLPTYLGAFYATGAFGPAVGFILNGIFLNSWVDPGNEPDNAEPTDEEWVGAWWTGYVIIGCVGLAMSIPLFLYPKYLPNTSHIRALSRQQSVRVQRRISLSKLDEVVDPSPTMMQQLRVLVANKTYVCNVLGQASESFMVGGFSAFLPKAVESIFGLSSSEASFTVGLVLIPGAAGGIFFGGWLMERLKATAVETAAWTWKIAAVAFCLMGGFYIGCDTISLAGVTSAYPVANSVSPLGGVNGNINLAATCNSNCGCNPDVYDPVCGDNGLNYFSACHAGCESVAGKGDTATYSNCSCITSSAFPSGHANAKAGKCSSGCNSLGGFLVMLFFIMFFTFMNNVPSTTVLLRSLADQYRPLGMGIQNASIRVLGFIPGPILFGVVIDSTCKFFETDCGSEGSCWEYDSTKLRTQMVLLGMIPKLVSFIWFFLSWWFFKPAAAAEAHGAHVELDNRE